MIRAFIGIGSNIDRYRHIGAALDSLGEAFGGLRLSPVYECEAMGFEGAPFLNLVAGVTTVLPLPELVGLLRRIEHANGYPGGAPKFSSRSLDLDLLTYGDLCGAFDGVILPRGDITAYAYVLWPLADIAGQERHPASGISYLHLKQQFSPRQQVRPVSFEWRGRDLSIGALPAPAS
jgi:2-amino-4-hydroxy-6-hydroxymethyldihydropteridine diphosphokinase